MQGDNGMALCGGYVTWMPVGTWDSGVSCVCGNHTTHSCMCDGDEWQSIGIHWAWGKGGVPCGPVEHRAPRGAMHV